MGEEWPIVSFRDCLVRVERKTFLEDLQLYETVGVRWYGNGAFIRDSLLGADIARKQQWIIEEDDVVYNKLFAWKGAFAVADGSVHGRIVSDKFPTYRVVDSMLSVDYLRWWFKFTEIARQAERMSRGGAAISKLTLNPPQFWDLTVPLPPVDEQLRIVRRLVAIQEQVEAAQGLRTSAVADAESLLQSTLAKVFNRIERHRRFEEVVVLKPRSGPSVLTHPDWPGTPVIMPSALSKFGVDLTKVEYASGVAVDNEKDVLRPGDLLIARGNKRAQVGTAGVVPNGADGWTYANLLMRVVLAPELADPHFCVYWLMSPGMRALVGKTMTGTNPNIQKINQRTILNFPFPDIPVPAQARLVEQLDELKAAADSILRRQRKTEMELNALLPAVMNRAFKGEL